MYGWVFSNCDSHNEAAAAYRRLIELCPDWIDGHRHLSGALAAAGRIDEAIAPAMTAAVLAPDNAEFALHRGRAAVGSAARRGSGRLGDARRRGGAGGELGHRNRRRRGADALRPGRGGREPAARASAESRPRLWRVLSGAEMLCGRLDGALDAAERARGAAPDNAEFALHHGHLLWRRGDMSEAAAAFAGAARLDPGGRDIKRAQMSFYLAAGLATEATVAGGELLHRFPDDKDRPRRCCTCSITGSTRSTASMSCSASGVGASAAPAASAARAAGAAAQPAPGRARVDHPRNPNAVRRYRLGYGWALIEPMLHIALLSATFAVLMHGRPPIGADFFVFYYTGLIRYSGADGTKAVTR